MSDGRPVVAVARANGCLSRSSNCLSCNFHVLIVNTYLDGMTFIPVCLFVHSFDFFEG